MFKLSLLLVAILAASATAVEAFPLSEVVLANLEGFSVQCGQDLQKVYTNQAVQATEAKISQDLSGFYGDFSAACQVSWSNTPGASVTTIIFFLALILTRGLSTFVRMYSYDFNSLCCFNSRLLLSLAPPWLDKDTAAPSMVPRSGEPTQISLLTSRPWENKVHRLSQVSTTAHRTGERIYIYIYREREREEEE